MGEEYTDLKLYSYEELFDSVIDENDSQLGKWGIQTKTLPEWIMFLIEEVGEIADAIGEFLYRNGEPVKIYSEAIQSATLALKIAEIARSITLQGGDLNNG